MKTLENRKWEKIEQSGGKIEWKKNCVKKRIMCVYKSEKDRFSNAFIFFSVFS